MRSATSPLCKQFFITFESSLICKFTKSDFGFFGSFLFKIFKLSLHNFESKCFCMLLCFSDWTRKNFKNLINFFLRRVLFSTQTGFDQKFVDAC